MSKDLQLSSQAAQIAKKTKAFVIIHLDENGKCTMVIDGNFMEVSFMEKSLQNQTLKIMYGGK